MLHELAHVLDVHFLINTFGYPGLFFIIFAETGLMLGFFLPGDSLLVTAGIFSAKGILSLWLVLPLLFVAGILGNTVGYYFGHKVGKKLFTREDSMLFHKRNIIHAQEFYKKYGGKAIILARFVPIVRTFAPIVAGIGDMPRNEFMLFNIIGGFLWTIGITILGFFLGNIIPDKFFEPMILLVIFISLLPGFYELLNTPEKRKSAYHKVRTAIKRNR